MCLLIHSAPCSSCSIRKSTWMNHTGGLWCTLTAGEFAQWEIPAKTEAVSKSEIKVFIALPSSLQGSWVSMVKLSTASVWWYSSIAMVLSQPSDKRSLLLPLGNGSSPDSSSPSLIGTPPCQSSQTIKSISLPAVAGHGLTHKGTFSQGPKAHSFAFLHKSFSFLESILMTNPKIFRKLFLN